MKEEGSVFLVICIQIPTYPRYYCLLTGNGNVGTLDPDEVPRHSRQASQSQRLDETAEEAPKGVELLRRRKLRIMRATPG